MPDRYVQLPNGSYLQWPEGVSAETFKAKATKLGLAPKPSEPTNRVNESMGKITGISAYHPKTGFAGVEEKMGDWRQRLSEFAGRGTSKEMGDLMASPALGAMRIVQGEAKLPQKGKTWEGVKDVAGGAMEEATIPSLMFAPEGAGAAKAALPSTAKAGKLLEAVERAAGHVPIDLEGPGKAAVEIQQMAKSGGTMPKVIRDFINRINRPETPPLTYSEARKFYENAISRFAPDIRGNPIKGKPRYMLAQFAKGLDRAIQGAAEKVGKGQDYAEAMRKYHSAANFEGMASKVGKKAKQAAGLAGAGAATAAGGKVAYDWIRR